MKYNFQEIAKIANRRFTKRLLLSVLLLVISAAEMTLLVLFGDNFPTFFGCIISWIVFGGLCFTKIKEIKCGKPKSAVGTLSKLVIDIKGVRKIGAGGIGLVRRKYDKDFVDLRCATIFISVSGKPKPVKIHLKGLDNFQINYYEKAYREQASLTHCFAARFPVLTVIDDHSTPFCPLCGALGENDNPTCPSCGEQVCLPE